MTAQNTLVIVAVQMPVARLVRGRRRMPTQALVGLVWAASWLAVPFAGGLSSGASATLVLCLVLAVFGIGECFHGAVQAPLVSDLARPELIGR